MTDAGKYNQPTTNEGGQITVAGPVGILDAGDNRIDPAEQGTLSSIDGKVATETTLSSRASETTLSSVLTALQSLVGALRSNDTDSIVTSHTARFTTVEYGQDTVPTAGTAVQLNGGTSVPIENGAELKVRALGKNTANIYVGDSNVTASTGFQLSADVVVRLYMNDVNNVWINSDNNNAGVTWIVEAP